MFIPLFRVTFQINAHNDRIKKVVSIRVASIRAVSTKAAVGSTKAVVVSTKVDSTKAAADSTNSATTKQTVSHQIKWLNSMTKQYTVYIHLTLLMKLVFFSIFFLFILID